MCYAERDYRSLELEGARTGASAITPDLSEVEQPKMVAGRDLGVKAIEWHSYSADSGVLEFHEELTEPGPALELQVSRDDDHGLFAIWLTAEGNYLAVARVGAA